ncbi:MAG TPA: methionyl-tRNA formyltransferase [Vicinamibacterales bacterium]|jgi:methionyl-tRNA formyltransferase|nr:methionyl-tRNA formyltransferase [Vicinamibacterales bacterium]
MVNPAPPLRIVFFGTPEFAVPTLNALLASQHAVVGVVTQPDRPSGRGQRLHPSPVKEVAEAHNLALLQPERLRNERFLNTLRDLNADIGVVAAYGRILTDTILQTPRLGLINLHASLLPKYRGAAPIHRAVMAGDPETGVTIMRVVQALDAGPMLSSVARPIGPEETSVDVELDLARLGAQALVNALDALSTGTATETPQDESAATYAHKLQKDDGIIRWSDPAQAIHNRIRGLHPWPHAYSELEGVRCLLLESRVDARTSMHEPGTIIEAAGDNLRVQTGDGVLTIVRLQLEGRRAVSTREFLAGHHPGPGARFTASQPQP